MVQQVKPTMRTEIFCSPGSSVKLLSMPISQLGLEPVPVVCNSGLEPVYILKIPQGIFAVCTTLYTTLVIFHQVR